jgi:drug/metabolite transporter (DMT)-like permease
LEAKLAAPALDRKKGLSMAAIGGLAISFDIPMVRLTNGDMWSVTFMRSVLLVGMALLIWLAVRLIAGERQALVPGKSGWTVLVLYGISTILFFYSVFATSTANLVFILAFNPMFSALFGWLILGERPKWQTFAAMFFMALGVFIIVRASLSGGHIMGDLAALGAAMIIALAIVLTRASGKEMGYVSLLSAIIPAVFATYFVWQQGGIQAASPQWIVLNGTFFMPLAFYFLAVAPAYIPGTHVAMFYLLETILAPVWVWLIFSETPTSQTLIGGGILLAALIAHSLWELNEERRARLSAPA